MTTRREFLALSGASLFVRPEFALAQESGDSGLVTGKPKPLKYEEIKGFLSKEQLTPHHGAHYAGAIKSLTPATTSSSASRTVPAYTQFSKESRRESSA